MKRAGKIGIWSAGFLGLSLASVAALSWRKPEPLPTDLKLPDGLKFPPEDWVGREADKVETPYQVRVPLGRGQIVVLGAHHTKNPSDPQLASIEAAWMQARPTVALVEGRPSGPLAAIQPVQKFGEGGLVARLARQDGVPTRTWNLPDDVMVRELARKFPKREVAVFFIGNKYFSELRFGKPSDPDQVMLEQIQKRGGYPEISGEISTVADLDRIWAEDFPGKPSWRDTTDEYGLPGYLEEIALAARQLRDVHLISNCVRLASEGERVFAICGLHHAVRIAPMLKKLETLSDAR